MSIAYGQKITAETFNAAFVSKGDDGIIEGRQTFSKELCLKLQESPQAPQNGHSALYFKADGRLYSRDASGSESLIGPPINEPEIPEFTAETTLAASFYSSASQSVSVGNAIKFDSQEFSAGLSISSSTGLVTIPRSGLWEIRAIVAASDRTNVGVKINSQDAKPLCSTTAQVIGNGSRLVMLQKDDQLSVVSSAAVTVNAQSSLSLRMIPGSAFVAKPSPQILLASKSLGSHSVANEWQTVSGWASLADSAQGFSAQDGTYTFKQAGTYLITGSIGMEESIEGERCVRLKKGPEIVWASPKIAAAEIGGEYAAAFALIVTAQIDEQLSLEAFQDSSGALQYSNDPGANILSIVKLGES